MVGSAAGYASVNVKIRAMKAKLLSLSDYDRIIQSGSLTESVRTIIGLVMPSKLAEDLSLLLASGDALDLVELDRVLTRSYLAVHAKLTDMSPENTRKVLDLYIKKYEYANLKTIIKAIHRGISPETIREFFIPSMFGESEELTELIHLESLSQLRDTLHDELAKTAIIDAFEAYEETGTTLPLELSLDRVLYMQLWEALSTLSSGDRDRASRLLGMRIDLINIMSVLRGVHLGLDPFLLKQFVIPITYRLKSLLDRAMESKTMLEAIRILPVRPYEEIINKIREIIEDNQSLAGAEQLLEDFFVRENSRVFMGYPFHIGTVLAFLNILFTENQNLRAILVGKAEGIDSTKIRDSLIFI